VQSPDRESVTFICHCKGPAFFYQVIMERECTKTPVKFEPPKHSQTELPKYALLSNDSWKVVLYCSVIPDRQVR